MISHKGERREREGRSHVERFYPAVIDRRMRGPTTVARIVQGLGPSMGQGVAFLPNRRRAKLANPVGSGGRRRAGRIGCLGGAGGLGVSERRLWGLWQRGDDEREADPGTVPEG